MNSKNLIAIIIGAAVAAVIATVVSKMLGSGSSAAIGGGVGGAMAAVIAVLVSMGCAATETEEGADAPEVEPVPIDAGAVIAAASEAMGVNDLDSIMYSGTAYNIGFGQTQNINGPYDGMGIDVDEYVRTIDLDMAAPRSYATRP